MNTPLFSILIANYNNGLYLSEALDSVYQQTYENWEIIIVDDSSSDQSSDIYQTLNKDKRIKIIYNDKNQGAGYTKKRCVDNATGSICGFLDPDDALANDALEKMIKAHSIKPSASLIYSTSYRCDEHLNIIQRNDAPRKIKDNDPYFFNMEGSISHFASFKKDSYMQTVGIDPYLQRAVDQDLYLKLYEVGETHYIDEALYYYRIHKGGISTNKNIEKAYYWHWVVLIETGKRRGLNLEDLFCETFIRKSEYDTLENKYLRLKKFEKINSYLGNLRRKL